MVVGEFLGRRCWFCANPPCTQKQVDGAIIVEVSAKAAKELGGEAGKRCLNLPLPSQCAFEETDAPYVLWGGQAGPGKSHGMRWWLYRRSLMTPGHTALLLRETNDELKKTHLRFMEQEVPLLGGIFKQGPPAQVYFPSSGSYIDCGHMSDAAAIRHHLGTNYGAIVAEEGSQYPLMDDGISPLGELSTRAREVYRDQAGRPVKPRFFVASNPGGPCSQWLLDFFIDHTPDFEVYPALAKVYDPKNYLYMPASLEDNPYQDPEYESQKLAILPRWRYEQLRHGDWRVFAGQFFSRYRASHHVRDWGTPSGCRWFRSMDWGFNSPGCVIWWAVLPDHRLYIRDDWKFQGLDEPEVARGVLARDAELGIDSASTYTVGDPSMFNKTGATHTSEEFSDPSKCIAQTLGYYGLPLLRGNRDRVNGWKRCQGLLRDAPDGIPWLVFHPDASYLTRTLPSAQSSKSDPDDVDTAGDDHALDAWRYGAMSPGAPAIGTVSSPSFSPGTVGALVKQALRKPMAPSRWGVR
jgi:hypothetical protein